MFASEKDPPPYVLVWDIASHGIVYRVHYFCGLWERDQAHTQILQCILKHLRQGGLRAAAPKLEHAAQDLTTWRSIMPSQVDVLYVLSSCALLDGLDAECLALLVSKSKLLTFQAEQTIVQAGETGSSAVVVVEGLLATTKKRGAVGEPVVLLSAGDSFGGEVALLGDAHPATLRTRTSATVCELTPAVLDALFTTRSDVVSALSSNLATMAAGTLEGAKRAADCEPDGLFADIERSIKRNFAGALRKGARLQAGSGPVSGTARVQASGARG